ncbi:MAG: hypothetical protein KC731_04370 [Myxococcales bacterium]|nr:hypothetical protein [Myxococcales bacterium]
MTSSLGPLPLRHLPLPLAPFPSPLAEHDLPAPFEATSVSQIELWIALSSAGALLVMCSKDGFGASDEIALEVESGATTSVVFRRRTASTDHETRTALSDDLIDGRAHYWSISFDGTGVQLSVDGGPAQPISSTDVRATAFEVQSLAVGQGLDGAVVASGVHSSPRVWHHRAALKPSELERAAWACTPPVSDDHQLLFLAPLANGTLTGLDAAVQSLPLEPMDAGTFTVNDIGLIELWLRPEPTRQRPFLLWLSESQVDQGALFFAVRLDGSSRVTVLFTSEAETELPNVDLCDGRFHHLAFFVDDDQLFLSVDGRPPVLLFDGFPKAITLPVEKVLVGCDLLTNITAEGYVRGPRIWDSSSGTNATTRALLARTHDIEQASAIMGRRPLFDAYRPPRVASYQLPSDGRDEHHFSPRFSTPAALETAVFGRDDLDLRNVAFIDLWVLPNPRSTTERQCLFEIADGEDVGNLFGLYLETGSSHASLAFKRNRLDDVMTRVGLGTIAVGRYNHIVLGLRTVVEADRFSQLEAQLIVNGRVVAVPDGTVAADALGAFLVRRVTCHHDEAKDHSLDGRLIGPRLWQRGEALPIQAVADYVPAYAEMDFASDELFGANALREGKLGQLVGSPRTFEYVERVRRQSQTKSRHVYYVAPSFSGKIGFFTDGTALDEPAWQRLDVFDEDDLVQRVDLGQRTFPFPLGKKLVGHPVALDFSEIKTIDFWIRPEAARRGPKRQTIVELRGVPRGASDVVALRIALDYRKRALVVEKERANGGLTVSELISGTDDYFLPDLFNGRFHHLCLQTADRSADKRLIVRVNGLAPIWIGTAYFLAFDFAVSSIVVASDSEGGSPLHGQLCGPRFWRGRAWDDRTLHHAAFTHFDVNPDLHELDHTTEIGRVAVARIGAEATTRYVEEGAWPGIGKNQPAFEVAFPAAEGQDRELRAYLGAWAHRQQEHRIPVQADLSERGISPDDHCFYEPTTYLALVRDERPHRLCLATASGHAFELRDITGQQAVAVDDEGKRVCRLHFETKQAEGKTIAVLRIVALDERAPRTGAYKRPYRKPDWAGERMGNIFLHRPSHFESMLVGYDITRIDPLQFDTEGRKGNPIFRLPPGASPWFDAHQGMAIPFGWSMVPYVSHDADTKSQFLTNQQELELGTSAGITRREDQDDAVSGKAGVEDAGSVNGSFESGLSSSMNRETARRVKRIQESQSFASIQRWYCTSHDIVLDPGNVLFDGQLTNYDDPEESDLASGFYQDIMDLKRSAIDERAQYFDFIRKYGTHYVSSVRFGSKGWRLHYFTQDVVDKLATHGLTLGFEQSSRSKVGVGGSGTVDGFTGGLETQVSIGKTKGSTASAQDESDLRNAIKAEDEEIGSRGSYQEGAVDPFGQIHVRRHLEPIYALLSPPHFGDVELLTRVRSKLKKYTKAYVAYERANFPRATFEDGLFKLRFSVRTPFHFSPSPEDIVAMQPETHDTLPLAESTVTKYRGMVTLDFDVAGEKKRVTFPFDPSNHNDDTFMFELLRREQRFLGGTAQRGSKQVDEEMVVTGSWTLDAEVTSRYHGVTTAKKLLYAGEMIAGEVFGGPLGLLVAGIMGHPKDQDEPVTVAVKPAPVTLTERAKTGLDAKTDKATVSLFKKEGRDVEVTIERTSMSVEAFLRHDGE